MGEFNLGNAKINDTGERILPVENGEISLVFSRHKFAYEYVQQYVENKTVIDVGCGTGYGCKIIANKAKLVYGIDHDKETIAFCQKHFLTPNIKYIKMDANSLNLDRKFDVAVTFQAIEHMPNLEAFIKKLKEIVNLGGFIFISTPNVKLDKKQKKANPFHLNEMSFDQFHKLLADNFSNFELLGVVYAKPNKLRTLVDKLKIYRWGRILTRKSKLKKIAARAMTLTEFKMINSNVKNEAADLLAVCQNS